MRIYIYNIIYNIFSYSAIRLFIHDLNLKIDQSLVIQMWTEVEEIFFFLSLVKVQERQHMTKIC